MKMTLLKYDLIFFVLLYIGSVKIVRNVETFFTLNILGVDTPVVDEE